METAPVDRILFVDDEPNVLHGLRRVLRRTYDFDTAVGGHEGLERATETDYAVIVSDMRMPDLSGPEFLAKVGELRPDAVQIVLSGQADLESTVQVVNDANVFRFLLKPIDRDGLRAALDAARHQHRLVTAERALLAETLAGAVAALTEVLAMVAPAASRRTAMVVDYVERISGHSGTELDWQLRLAAMLSGIGYAAVPGGVLERALIGDELTTEEAAMVARHAQVTESLLGNIPRLGGVTALIAAQAGQATVDLDLRPQLEILDAAVAAADRVVGGDCLDDAAASLRGLHRGQLLDRLQPATPAVQIAETLPIRGLKVGMTLVGDIVTTTGLLTAAKGTTLTPSLLERVVNFHESIGVVEPVEIEPA